MAMEHPNYSIKLDDFDVNYILKHDFQSLKALPLWDLNGRSVYQQFQVLVGKRPEDHSSTKDKDNPLNYEKYECTLCNANVPKMYKSEHNNSPKHKLSIGIIKTALERVTSMLLTNDEPTITKTPNAYYCETCDNVVANDERNHESSEAHQKAKQYLKILNALHMIYKNKDYVDNVDFKYLTKNVVTSGNTDNSASDSKIEENDDSTVDHSFVLPAKVENEFLKDVTSKRDVKGTETKNAEPIHLFKAVGTNQVQTNKHMEMIKIPLMDRHCLRQIVSTSSNYVSYHHCVLCNINFSDIDDHKASKEHEEALLEAVAEHQSSAVDTQTSLAPSPTIAAFTNVAAAKTSKMGKTYCENCDLYIDTHNYRAHLQGRKHALGRMLSQINKNNTETKDNTKESQINTIDYDKTEPQLDSQKNFARCESSDTSANKYHTNETTLNEEPPNYHFQPLDPNHVYCRVCQNLVPNRVLNTIDHLNGGNHTINLHRLLSTNKISKKFYCHHCQVNIDFQKELDHVTTLQHKSAKGEAVTAKVETKLAKPEIAKIDTNTPGNSSNPKDESYTAQTTSHTTDVHSHAAQTTSHTTDVDSHSSSTSRTTDIKSHAAQTTSLKTKVKSKKGKANTYKIVTPFRNETLHYHLQVRPLEHHVYCRVCEANIAPNNVNYISMVIAHLFSDGHKRAFNARYSTCTYLLKF